MKTSASGSQMGGDKAVIPYNYIERGELSEKVSCNMKSTGVGKGAAFNKCGHIEVLGSPRGVGNKKIRGFLRT